jgi:hypothetical protein
MNFTTKANDNVVIVSLFIAVFFVFSPLLTLIAVFIVLNTGYYTRIKLHSMENKLIINLYCVLCAVFVACINVVKVPENDLEWYIESYKGASYTNFIDYINGGAIMKISKEHFYFMLVWCMNRLFDSSVNLFKFSITIINYLLLNFAIVKFCRHFKFSIDKIIVAVFLMCFIPYIFTMSLQLVRQFLAGSILMYVLIDKCFYQKNNWLLLIAMVLTHSTSLFFLPFFFLPFLDKPLKNNKIYYFIYIIVLIGVQIVANILLNSGLFNAISSLNNALERASQDTTFGSETLPLWKIAVTIAIAVWSFYLGYIKIDKINYSKGLKRWCNVIIFLSVFILLNLDQSELSSRLLFYLFPFIPFIIVWFFNSFKLSNLFTIPFVFAIVFFWITYLDIGTWTYKLPANIWISPVFLYFIN